MWSSLNGQPQDTASSPWTVNSSEYGLLHTPTQSTIWWYQHPNFSAGAIRSKSRYTTTKVNLLQPWFTNCLNQRKNVTYVKIQELLSTIDQPANVNAQVPVTANKTWVGSIILNVDAFVRDLWSVQAENTSTDRNAAVIVNLDVAKKGISSQLSAAIA